MPDSSFFRSWSDSHECGAVVLAVLFWCEGSQKRRFQVGPAMLALVPANVGSGSGLSYRLCAAVGRLWGPLPEILEIVQKIITIDPNLALDMSFFLGANFLERLP